MSEMTFGQTYAALDEKKISTRKDPVYGPVTVFHDVVIVRENVQPFPIDGQMLKGYKSADQLEQYWPWVDGRWAIAGRHPDTPVIVKPGDIAGRTVNPRFVKNLRDHGKTERQNIRGILADLEVFNDRVAPALLKSMIEGELPAVSIGYLYGKDMTPGSWNGDSYDFVQTNMFHDHLAFGINEGRCDYPACGIGADTLLEAKCLNDGCQNREVRTMETGKEPVETDTLISIPNPGVDGCEDSKSIALSEGDISLVVCGDENKISAFVFAKDKDWTMEKAVAWVEENQEGAADLLATRLEVVAAADAIKARAMEHFAIPEEAWDVMNDAARTTMIAGLPDETPTVGEDMSEDEVKAKIVELQQQIDAFYESKERADPVDYSEVEPLYAEKNAYKEALEELIKKRVLDETETEGKDAVDEVDRAKRLLNSPRLVREIINPHTKS